MVVRHARRFVVLDPSWDEARFIVVIGIVPIGGAWVLPGCIASDPDFGGVEVFPEIAAPVVGYARLRRRREGLHVMVNVGPSTIDVCGFGPSES